MKGWIGLFRGFRKEFGWFVALAFIPIIILGPMIGRGISEADERQRRKAEYYASLLPPVTPFEHDQDHWSHPI